MNDEWLADNLHKISGIIVMLVILLMIGKLISL